MSLERAAPKSALDYGLEAEQARRIAVWGRDPIAALKAGAVTKDNVGLFATIFEEEVKSRIGMEMELERISGEVDFYRNIIMSWLDKDVRLSFQKLRTENVES